MSGRKRSFSHDSRPRDNFTSYDKRRRSESRPRPRSLFVNHDHDFQIYFNEDRLKSGKQFFEVFFGWQSPFSQNYKTEFTVAGMTFSCAQQYYMYQKAALFENEEIQRLIMNTTDQNEMKKLGKDIPNFDRGKWMKHAVDVVRTASRAKFTQNNNLKEKLLATYPKILVEANRFDNIWGIGVSKNDSAAWNMRAWQGENLLGFILTEVRDELIQLEETGEAMMQRVRESNASTLRERKAHSWANESTGSINESKESKNEIKECMNESQESLNESQVNMNESQESMNESTENKNGFEECMNESKESLNESKERLNESQESMIENQVNINESQVNLNESPVSLNESSESGVLRDNKDSAMEKKTEIALVTNIDKTECKSENIERNVNESVKGRRESNMCRNSESKEKTKKESTIQRNTESFLSKMKKIRSAKDGHHDEIDCEPGESDSKMDEDMKEDGEIEHDESHDDTFQRDEKTDACWEEEWRSEDITEQKEKEQESRDKKQESRSRRRHSERRWDKDENWDDDIDRGHASWEIKKPEPPLRERSSIGALPGVEDLRNKVNRRRSESVLPRMTPTLTKHNHIYKSYFEPENIIHDPDKLELFFGWYSPFSQHHPANFEIEGKMFSCAEQWYMYNKAVLFHDKGAEDKIMGTTDPKVMKMLGRTVRNFDRITWMDNAIDIVKRGNLAKFSQNPHLKEQLFDTHPRVLVEASPGDSVWGVGLHKSNPAAWDMRFWKGENLLGFTLTRVREELMGKDSFLGSAGERGRDRGRSLIRRGDFPEDFGSRREKYRSESLPSRLAQPEIRNHEHLYKSKFESRNMICGYKNFVFFFGKEFPFSNHHPAQFVIEGKMFSSSEQYYMYQKAVMFKDKEIEMKILNSPNPKEQKRLGKLVKNFDYRRWLTKAVDVTRRGLMAKFSQNPHLKSQLLETHPRTLVEASPGDKIWGIGLGRDDPRAWDMRTWRGENLLGFTLMNVREELRRGEEESRKGDRRRSEKFRRNQVYSMHADDNDDEEGRGVSHQSRAKRRRSHYDSPSSELEKNYLKKKYKKTSTSRKKYSDSEDETKYNKTSRKKYDNDTHKEKKDRKSSQSRKRYRSSSDTESDESSRERGRSNKRRDNEPKRKDRGVHQSHVKYDSESEESTDRQKYKKSSRDKGQKTSKNVKFHRTSRKSDSSSSSSEDSSPDRKKTHTRKTSKPSQYENISSTDDSSIERPRRAANTSESWDSDQHTFRTKVEVEDKKDKGKTLRTETVGSSSSSDECKHVEKKAKVKSESNKEQNKTRDTEVKTEKEADSSSDGSDESQQRKKPKPSSSQEIPKSKHVKDFEQKEKEMKKPRENKTDRDSEKSRRREANENKRKAKTMEGKTDKVDPRREKVKTESESDLSSDSSARDKSGEYTDKRHCDKIRSKSMSALATEDLKFHSGKSSGRCEKNDDIEVKREQMDRKDKTVREKTETKKSKNIPKHGKDQRQAEVVAEEVDGAKSDASSVNKDGNVTEERKKRKRKATFAKSHHGEDPVPNPERAKSSLDGTRGRKRVKVNDKHREERPRSEEEDASEIFIHVTDEDKQHRMEIELEDCGKNSAVEEKLRAGNVSNTCQNKKEEISDSSSKLSKTSKSMSFEEMEHRSLVPDETCKQNYEYVTLGKCDIEDVKIIEEKETFKKKEKEFKSKINKRNYRRSDGHENSETTKTLEKENISKKNVNKVEKQNTEKTQKHEALKSKHRPRERTERVKSSKYEFEERKYSRTDSIEERERRVSKSSKSGREIESQDKKRYADSLERRSSEQRESRSFKERHSVETTERKEKWSTHSESRGVDRFETKDARQKEMTDFIESKKLRKDKSISLTSSKEVPESPFGMDIDDDDNVFVSDSKKYHGRKRKFSSVESTDNSMETPSHKKKKDNVEKNIKKESIGEEADNKIEKLSKKKMKDHKKESFEEDASHLKEGFPKKDKKKKKKKKDHKKKKSYEEFDQDVEELNNLEKSKKKKKKKKKTNKSKEEESDKEDMESREKDSKMTATKVGKTKMADKKKGRKSNDSDSSREEKKIFIKINSKISVRKNGSGEETDWSANCKFDVTCDSTQ